jgi:hypothetical protein
MLTYNEDFGMTSIVTAVTAITELFIVVVQTTTTFASLANRLL